ncbi:MAG: hypothetical protein U5L96_08090 [Owenweeksia sp.]|nr:hypothetical protein [Owenweeksia sp.]
MKLKVWAPVLIGLVSAILCIRQVGEPDVWWQVRTGEYILEQGEVPEVDVFSYTYNGDPWFNVKWGTEVVMALFVKALGPEFLMLMQWLVLLGILLLLYGIYQQLGLALVAEKPNRGVGFYFALLLFLAAMAFRMNARPEMMSHLMTVAFLYLFVHYYNHRSRLIFLLVPLQLLWANLHEAFGVGMVLIIIYNSAAWFEYIFIKTKNGWQRRELVFFGLVSVLALASVMVHPMGIPMLWQPYEIYSQLGENKFTTELWSFKHEQYWTLPAYLGLMVLLGLVLALWRKSKGRREFRLIPLFLRHYSTGFCLPGSIGQPQSAVFISGCFSPAGVVSAAVAARWPTGPCGAFAIAGVMFYIYIGSGNFYKRFMPVEKYGLRVDAQTTPIGAAQFLKNHNVTGHGFVDYFSSSFFLWYLQPDYKSYLDLRDLDVFEPMFISNNLLAYTRPNTPTKSGKALFRFMEEIDHFNYAVMGNNIKFSNFHKYMTRQEDYHLVYATPLSSVYLKDNDTNRALLQKYKGRSLDELFHPYGELPTAPAAYWISKLMWPGYEPTAPDQYLARHREVYRRDYR